MGAFFFNLSWNNRSVKQVFNAFNYNNRSTFLKRNGCLAFRGFSIFTNYTFHQKIICLGEVRADEGGWKGHFFALATLLMVYLIRFGDDRLLNVFFLLIARMKPRIRITDFSYAIDIIQIITHLK
jgi:hypothetical protein